MEKKGKIEVITGCMSSGKTEELIRRIGRAQIAGLEVPIFVPAIDSRSGRNLRTHASQSNSRSLPARQIQNPKEILELVTDDIAVIGVDEVQFFDHTIVDVCQKLADNGLRVIVAGLDMDFRGQPFGPMPNLMAQAEEVAKLYAICTFKGPDGRICGSDAMYSQRIINGKPAPWDALTVVIGAEDVYQPRCWRHFQRPKSIF